MLLSAAGSAYALEANYPTLPMIGTITEDSGLGQYVAYFFGLAMYLAGALAVISFTIGAVQTIMTASSPEVAKDGKDRMKSALLGLVLTLSAFVILQTINPNFISPTLTPLPGVAGIFYTKGDLEDLKPTPMAVPNIADTEIISKGYNKIYFKCTEEADPTKVTPLIIWKFPLPNFEGIGGTTVEVLGCGGVSSIGGAGSFKMAFKTPGIYYFLQENCQGYMSGPNTTTQNNITEPFTGKIKSVRIVNDFDGGKYYGAIFHSSPDAEKASDCTNPMLATDDEIIYDESCSNLSEFSFFGFTPYSVEIFNWNLGPAVSSGDGVWFYGNVNGWDSGNKSGAKQIIPNLIGSYFMQSSNSTGLRFDYTEIGTSLGKLCYDAKDEPACRQAGADVNNCCPCAFPSDWSFASKEISEEVGCGGSIKFGGTYLVTLYTDYVGEVVIKNDDGTEEIFDVEKQYCQSFKKDTPNLSTQGSFLPSGTRAELSRINIIPIH